MQPSKSISLASASCAKRLQHVAVAFEAFRRVNKPGQRIPRGLRAQVVAALGVGVSATSLQRACKLSWSQLTRWKSEARVDGELSTRQQPQVLSVVEADAPGACADAEVELRVGSWRICLSRASD